MKSRVVPFLLLLGSCSSPEPRPADLLSRDRFTEVLMEAQLVEARMNQELVLDKRSDAPGRQYYTEMFTAQGVTEQAFTNTFQWYVEHPDSLKDIYNDVLTRLQRRVDVTDSTAGAH